MVFLENFLKKFGSTGVQKLFNASVFNYLHYIAVFPVAVGNKVSDLKGNVLPDVFLMKPNSTAIDLAAAVHSAMAEKFVKAIDVRSGRAHGADYVLKHRDVLEIAFGR